MEELNFDWVGIYFVCSLFSQRWGVGKALEVMNWIGKENSLIIIYSNIGVESKV